MKARLRPSQMPLRLRLTLWYTFSLALILLLFTTFLYSQVRRSLIGQVDAALNLATGQALILVSEVEGQLTFQSNAQNPDAVRSLRDDFAIQLLAEDGTVLDTLSSDDQVPIFPIQTAAFNTQDDDSEPWRVYQQAIQVGQAHGWLQVAQELEPVNVTLSGLQAQIAGGLPIALLLAGVGGYFLASRALNPLARITETAEAISGSDLERRINYQGPPDEIGRLAQTFDKMLERLQGAFIRERRFTGDAAHELRTPLAALKGHLGVTLSQPRPLETYRESLQEMEGQVDRLIRLSNDLLFIARLDGRLDQRQLEARREKIDLTDFISAILDQVRPLATDKGITLTYEPAPGLTLQGDLDLLIRLFLNLLDNAVKYTAENGRVTIETQPLGQDILISIKDTGPGIAPDHLPHLFGTVSIGSKKTELEPGPITAEAVRAWA